MQRRVIFHGSGQSLRGPAWQEEIEVNQDAGARIAQLLNQVGETHHIVFSDTDGNDEDWATFYSDWLLVHSDLPKLLGRRPIRSHLTRDLVQLDEEYAKSAPSQPWPAWYAERLIAKYGSS